MVSDMGEGVNAQWHQLRKGEVCPNVESEAEKALGGRGARAAASGQEKSRLHSPPPCCPKSSTIESLKEKQKNEELKMRLGVNRV